MPNIIFNNLKKEDVKKISKDITKELSQIVGSPEDWFTFTYVESSVFISGSDNSIVFVTVSWFRREKDIQDKVAKLIENAVVTITRGEVCIVFQPIEDGCYYEN